MTKINTNPTIKQLNETRETLQNLIVEDHLSWHEAITEFRLEFGYSLSYCMRMGVVRYFQEVDKNYNK